MKQTKLFWIFTLLTIGIFVLAACGSSPTSTATPVVKQENSPATATVAPITNAIEATGTDGEHNDGHEHAADSGEMMGDGGDSGSMMDGTDGEHNDGHEHMDVPEAYAAKTNPFKDNPDAVTAGAQLYTTYCATCHGIEGKGDGPAGTALEPHPANLADAGMMNNMSDAYLFWRISEGGMIEPFNSAMPPWKGSLTEEQIWQVIVYLRTLAK